MRKPYKWLGKGVASRVHLTGSAWPVIIRGANPGVEDAPISAFGERQSGYEGDDEMDSPLPARELLDMKMLPTTKQPWK